MSGQRRTRRAWSQRGTTRRSPASADRAAVRSIYCGLAELNRERPSGIETVQPERAIALTPPPVDFLAAAP